jgi:phage terminase small subunit
MLNMKHRSTLTDKQQRFVAEYLIDLNATQAAIRAGYSQKTARALGCENLTKPDIQEEIQSAMKAREQRTHITADKVLQELARIAFFDLRKLYRKDGTMKAIHELDDDAAAVLAGVDVTEEFTGRGEERELSGYTKKARVFDKGAALTLAMRHLGMLTDKTEVTAKVSTTTGSVRELSDDELLAIIHCTTGGSV